MSTPQSKISICAGVRLSNDYQHSIWFDSKADQEAYFAGKVVKEFTGYTYLRKSWNIKVAATFEQARTWTYLFFKNYSDGKYWYYFINQIEYVNDSTVELKLELDVFQTYLKDYTLLPCFVEREHAAEDVAGYNLIPENLDLGEMVVNTKNTVDDLNDLSVLMLLTFNPLSLVSDGMVEDGPKFRIDGIYTALSCVRVKNQDAFDTNFWDMVESKAQSDGIFALWMYPSALIKDATDTEGMANWSTAPFVDGAKSVNHVEYFPDRVDNYKPRNQKLLTYPFSFMYVTNNNGGAAVYHYEWFKRFESRNYMQFKIYGAISPDASIKLVPEEYKHIALNQDESLGGPNYPSCAWDQDQYKLWLAQNQNAHANQTATAVITAAAGIVGGIVAGGAVGALAAGGAVLGAAATISNQVAQKRDAALQPVQAKGQFASSLNKNAGCLNFTFYKKSISAQQAEILDQYFDLYGYATQQVKVPNRNVRKHYTYTKTVGCTISANLCTEDKRKIEAIFDNGITLWKNGDNIGNYSETIRAENAV